MKILSIDGGGVFGYLPATFLNETPGVLKQFDFFAGTSVGSTIAAMAAMGMTEADVKEHFKKTAHVVFGKKNHFWRPGPKYCDCGLNKVLQSVCETRTMGDVEKPFIAIAFDMLRRRPKVFESFDEQDKKLPLWQVIRASCAAPVYLAPLNGYIDGGVVANNPAVMAAVAARAKWDIPFKEQQLCSMGTGRQTHATFWNNKKAAKRWPWQWVGDLTDLVTNGNEAKESYIASMLDLGHYVRFDPVALPDTMHFTNPEKLPILETMALRFNESWAETAREFGWTG